MKYSQTHSYVTAGGIQIFRASIGVDYTNAVEEVITQLDSHPGVLLSSSYEFPGRYARWDIGFANPPVRISSRNRSVTCEALNSRGEVMLRILKNIFAASDDIAEYESTTTYLRFVVRAPELVLIEEERTRQRSVFSVLRNILQVFASPDDDYLGLYGAFGYELAFQFEAPELRIPRTGDERNLVLYLPDTILVVDHKRETAQHLYYDFAFDDGGVNFSTRDLPRVTKEEKFQFVPADESVVSCDHAPGQYAETVSKALQYFARGDLFETVPGQTFSRACEDSPAQIFRRLQKQNPAPFGALLNLGEQEYLVAASPEMYVRVEGRRVETCPISGTIARGKDAIEDAEQIRTLLNSAKDEAELSMCTDVDRNDKARVCEAGSIKVIGRRQIEMYSRLIHTVDHVEGKLKPGMDALDAFLSHTWAVTVTGAPKQAAIQFIEDHELTPRRWYGGALGCLSFNGDLNTGLTIRTLRIQNGKAEVRAGATLLFDSDPHAEEAETRLKASAMLKALHVEANAFESSKQASNVISMKAAKKVDHNTSQKITILMVDHQDSFVHTLSSYFQQCGASVVTVRYSGVAAMLEKLQPQLVVLSPGPGRPQDFKLADTLDQCLALQIPVFGVCLGLQGIVEYFGGSLGVLDYPMHGKQSLLKNPQGFLFAGLGEQVQVGRYHSLVATTVPDALDVVANTEDGIVMAVQHKTLPVAAVQFHPESILSLADDAGLRIVRNVLQYMGNRDESPEETLMANATIS
ncbi:MAG: anthranilate synthase component I [Pseudomonadota bacterium]